jgi:hypothetical protein
MDVWISSGTHVDSIFEREERINEQFESPDVIFAEGAEKIPDREQLVSILGIAPVAPLIAAAVIFHIYISVEARGIIKLKITGGESGRDVKIVQNLTSRHDIEWHEIDNERLGQYIRTDAISWGIINWGSLLGITILVWPSPLSLWNTIKYGTVLLLAGYILFIGLLAVANHAREETMTNVITNKSKKYDQAIVVLGEAHHPGIGRRLSDESKLNVLNPEPEGLDWGTRVILRIFERYDRIKE